jgi:hypothetical protein
MREEHGKKTKWYKQNAKPTKMNVVTVVDALEDRHFFDQISDLYRGTSKKTEG